MLRRQRDANPISGHCIFCVVENSQFHLLKTAVAQTDCGNLFTTSPRMNISSIIQMLPLQHSIPFVLLESPDIYCTVLSNKRPRGMPPHILSYYREWSHRQFHGIPSSLGLHAAAPCRPVLSFPSGAREKREHERAHRAISSPRCRPSSAQTHTILLEPARVEVIPNR